MLIKHLNFDLAPGIYPADALVRLSEECKVVECDD